MNGRTIKIYLVEGTPSSTLIAEIINWTGKAIVTPRTSLTQLAPAIRRDVNRTGIYILVGEDPDTPTKERIYIGESDNVFNRLIQHTSNESKDFWSRTIVFISKDDNLTKAHVRYLESRLIKLTRNAGRATLANGTAPEFSGLPEPDIADMDFFLTQVEMLLPVLGFTFALPVPITANSRENTDRNVDQNAPTFALNAAGTNAKAQEINGEFVVFKGSTARKITTGSFSGRYQALRDQLVKDEKLMEREDGFYVFTDNVSFNSPTAAAAVVSGSICSGPAVWKVLGTNQTYREWQASQIQLIDAIEPDDEQQQFTEDSMNIDGDGAKADVSISPEL